MCKYIVELPTEYCHMVGYLFLWLVVVKKTNMMKIGYSFDVITNPLRYYAKGTHELMLNFCVFPARKIIPRTSNPFILE